jgi:hypothetical protein
MTVVVGMIAPNGDVYIGGDSAGTTSEGSQSVYVNKKVFSPVHGPAYLMGICGTHRLSQVLRYSFVPPPPPGPDTDLEEFFCTEFINCVREAFNENGVMASGRDGTESGPYGEFMVAYQGRIMKVEDNFQVLIDRRPYVAIGSGEDIALGAMYALEGHVEDPSSRISVALKAAVSFNAMCREPLEVMRLPFDPTWHQPVKRARSRKKVSGKSKGK